MTAPAPQDSGDAGDRSTTDLSDAFGRPATASLRGLLPPRPRSHTESTPIRTADTVSLRSVPATHPEPPVAAPDGLTPDASPRGDAAVDDATADDVTPDDGTPDDAVAQTSTSDASPRETAEPETPDPESPEPETPEAESSTHDVATPEAAAPAPDDGTSAPAAPGDHAPERAAPEQAPRPGRRPTTTERPAGRTTGRGARAATGNRRWGSVRLASPEHVELLVLVALSRGSADGRELAERLRTDSAGDLAPPPTTVQRTLHQLVRHGLAEPADDTERRCYRLTELGTRIVRARVRAWRSLRRAVDAVVDTADEV
ncbi:PadR family transcriptional regulator [Actinomycetospora sp. C-140]